ncbi:uncharacterized protein LOC119683949 [Teleopsis dalmanni]|uniref:uncharacterized protein LOC119683949 n=1 Tax=Teleopsis dalmanni TaxID=139649 RepID=UPI0018CEF5BD|nr:uncharacterized protein LOC119683949 [Teleopsis dalmanni]
MARNIYDNEENYESEEKDENEEYLRKFSSVKARLERNFEKMKRMQYDTLINSMSEEHEREAAFRDYLISIQLPREDEDSMDDTDFLMEKLAFDGGIDPFVEDEENVLGWLFKT